MKIKLQKNILGFKFILLSFSSLHQFLQFKIHLMLCSSFFCMSLTLFSLFFSLVLHPKLSDFRSSLFV
jgi:hypothetical protein